MQVLSWRNWSSKVAACALLTAAALPVTAAAGGSAFAATPAMTTVIASLIQAVQMRARSSMHRRRASSPSTALM